jgi:serine/threonine-protein kinase
VDLRERDAWREADRLLDDLLDLEPSARDARLATLDATDPALAARVRRLLQAHARDDGPVDAIARAVPLACDLSGRVLGRWRLEVEIGRGGMAAVYRATSLHGPAGQLAAVKVLTLGALAQGGRERFVREQHVLARLRHPHIAPLYDAGIAEDGTPWLAMALVEGERADAWCERTGCDVASRVDIACQVGAALAHAHRALIIHRDVKPSNVLVEHGGHARLLDFGIAQLVDGGSERTATALRALTPEYAAPEQFTGTPATTAIDVYGLGAFLHRLLTGRAPRAGGAAATQPASRIARDGAGVPPAQLRGDLDTILAKALAEKPEDRYASVEALVDDLQRWKARLPIRARPASLRYRSARFVSRHRIGVAATAAVMLAVGAGFAGVAWQAQRAQRAAEESAAQLRILQGVLDGLAPSDEAHRALSRPRIIEEAWTRAQGELATRPSVLATVEVGLADVAERAGAYPLALRLYEAARHRRARAFGADSAEVADVLWRSSDVYLQLDPPRPAEADGRAARAVALLAAREASPMAQVLALTNRAAVLGGDDRYEPALEALARAQALCRSREADPAACEGVALQQAALLRRQARHDEAVARLEPLLAARRARLGEGHAQTLHVASELAQSLQRGGHHARALAMLERIHAAQQRVYAEPTRETLATLQNLAEALANDGQWSRALALREAHIEQTRALYGERHSELASSQGNLAGLYFAMARFDEAHAAYLRCREGYEALYGPDHAGALICLGNEGDVLRELGRLDEAEALQRRALEAMARVFGAASPQLASRASNLARTRLARGDARGAIALFDRSLQLRDSPAAGADLVRAYRAAALLDAGRVRDADAASRGALAGLEREFGRAHRYYGEGLAMRLRVACAAGAADCPARRAEARAQLARADLAGAARARLLAALGAG